MRLFIAICFPENIKNVLLKACSDFKAAGVSGNVTNRANLHLTLAFLGEVKPSDVKKVKDALAAVDIPGIELCTDGTGRFGDLIWAGIRADKCLDEYVAALRRELDSKGIRYDGKPFRPHVTLIRRAKNYGNAHIEVPHTCFAVNKISLMKSERINGRMVYTEIFYTESKQ